MEELVQAIQKSFSNWCKDNNIKTFIYDYPIKNYITFIFNDGHIVSCLKECECKKLKYIEEFIPDFKITESCEKEVKELEKSLEKETKV